MIDRHTVKGIIVFVLIMLFSALAGWLGGYNFDTRSGDVAVGFLASMCIGIISGFVVANESRWAARRVR